ncbi:MAG TPA: FtsW/RodA/SpoVE family cell cycle protein, partial [Bacilli bacterium]
MKSLQTAQRGTPDFFLLILILILVGFGLVMVFSASYSYFPDRPFYFTQRQIMWITLGTIGMLFFMNTNYLKLNKWFVPYFIVVVIMLILVLLIGKEYNGARSWFGIGSFGGQPSEFAKLGIILYLATLISKKGEKFLDFQKGLLPVLLITGFVAGLIMLQPDLGSTLIFLICALIVIIVGWANLKHLFV